MSQYDPNKRYSWTPDDKFELSGEQFGIILNTFRSILNTPEAARILMVNNANSIIEQLMQDSVIKGVVKEVEEPSPSSEMKVVK